MCVQTPCQMGVCHTVHKHTCAHGPTLLLFSAEGSRSRPIQETLETSGIIFISEEHGSCVCGNRSEAQPTLERMGLRKRLPTL